MVSIPLLCAGGWYLFASFCRRPIELFVNESSLSLLSPSVFYAQRDYCMTSLVCCNGGWHFLRELFPGLGPFPKTNSLCETPTSLSLP